MVGAWRWRNGMDLLAGRCMECHSVLGLRVESLVGLLRLMEAFTLADFECGGFYEKVSIKTIIES